MAGGVPESSVHAELFYVGDAPDEPVEVAEDTGEVSEVTVTLAGRTSTIPVPFSGPSILDAMLAYPARCALCLQGRRLRHLPGQVVDGEVRMTRNYALEPEEIAAGLVLACQSHPVSRRSARISLISSEPVSARSKRAGDRKSMSSRLRPCWTRSATISPTTGTNLKP